MGEENSQNKNREKETDISRYPSNFGPSSKKLALGLWLIEHKKQCLSFNGLDAEACVAQRVKVIRQSPMEVECSKWLCLVAVWGGSERPLSLVNNLLEVGAKPHAYGLARLVIFPFAHEPICKAGMQRIEGQHALRAQHPPELANRPLVVSAVHECHGRHHGVKGLIHEPGESAH